MYHVSYDYQRFFVVFASCVCVCHRRAKMFMYENRIEATKMRNTACAKNARLPRNSAKFQIIYRKIGRRLGAFWEIPLGSAWRKGEDPMRFGGHFPRLRLNVHEILLKEPIA